MRQLIIDIGNSSAKVALFEGDTLAEHIHAEHDKLPQLLIEKAGDSSIQRAIVSSVIPLGEAIENAIASLPFPCLRMSAQLKMPFRIAYKTPNTLGPDRLAAIVGAWAQQPEHDLLVIDSGTAITYDILTSDGIYRGGNISPGIEMRFKALNHYTGKLPLINKEGERVEIGESTETAIREGILQGVDYEIEGYRQTYTLKYPKHFVFLTGGNAILLDNRVKSRTFVDNLLVVKGLNRILTLNNE